MGETLVICCTHLCTYIYTPTQCRDAVPLGGMGGGLGRGSCIGLSGVEAAVSSGTNALPVRVEQTTPP